MGRPQFRIGKPGSRANNDNRHVVIADIHPDLLKAAGGRKRGDGVDKRPQAA